MNLAVNNTSLFLAAMLVLVALGISLWQKLGLDRDIVIGVVRAVVQLFIVGYLLKYIFRVNNLWLTLAMMGFIIFNAAWNAKKRGPGIDHALAISLLAIFVSTGVTLGVLVLSGAIKFVPSQMIPISGMIASNSMVAVGLAYRSLNSQFHDQRQGVLERLALGAGLLDASIAIVREAILTGMSPTIDSAKVLSMGPKRLVLTLAIRDYVVVYFVQLRIAKVNPFPPIDETSTLIFDFSDCALFEP